jgi:biopolymer transport protein ExbB
MRFFSVLFTVVVAIMIWSADVYAATNNVGVTVQPGVSVTANDMSGQPKPALMPVPTYGMSFGEAWRYGGNIMWVLAAMSVFGLAMVIYLAGVLREAQIAPKKLQRQIIDGIRKGDLANVRSFCEASRAPLASVVLAAIDYMRQATHAECNLMREAIEAEGTRQTDAMHGQVQILLDISVIAPMLGLLGTVLGMLKAFGSVAQDVASAKPVVLAAGVSQAIITTIFGLIVAIFAMVAYAYFRRRATRCTALLETSATALTAAMMERFER